MQIDMELALVGAKLNLKQDIQKKLPARYFVEDQRDRGWGLVIRCSQKLPSELNEAIDGFLTPLISLTEVICNTGGVLRIGIFFNTATCTVRLNIVNQLTTLKVTVEITTYPAFDA